MDKLVLDLETKNAFSDIGNVRDPKALDLSFVGIYSYNRDQFLSFHETEIQNLKPFLQNCGLLIGFSINRFDLPVLQKHFDFNLMALPRLDLLEEIELSFGRRVGLNILAKANLGMEKTLAHGLEAIRLYREGNLKELEEYCLHDVRLTRDLYELARKQGYLTVPRKETGEPVKVEFRWAEEILPATLF